MKILKDISHIILTLSVISFIPMIMLFESDSFYIPFGMFIGLIVTFNVVMFFRLVLNYQNEFI